MVKPQIAITAITKIIAKGKDNEKNILKSAKDNQEVKDFYTFIFTKKAQKILENYGYKISIASP